MKYNILVVEERIHEIDKARVAIEAQGHIMVSVLNVSMAIERMDEANGVITDFLFSPWGLGARHFQERAKALGYYENMPPSGTIILIEAIVRSLPVVVCAEMYKDDQPSFASPDYAWFYDGYLKSLIRGSKMPFGWVPDKDWDKAVELLIAGIGHK